MSRRDEHISDVKEFGLHIQQSATTEGGACLTGHESGRQRRSPGYLKENSCNYRWQAFKHALEDKYLYNYPVYDSLCQIKSHIKTRIFLGFIRYAKPPVKYEWDITKNGENFRTSCNTPYWHEAHHIVTHGELHDSINSVGEGSESPIYRHVIRKGLLEEKYNLNHKSNMIILPMDKRIAEAIGLPRHRRTPRIRSHRAYSKIVRSKLDKVFKPIQQEESAHKKTPDYKECRKKIGRISSRLRPLIKNAGGKISMDEAFAARGSWL